MTHPRHPSPVESPSPFASFTFSASHPVGQLQVLADGRWTPSRVLRGRVPMPMGAPWRLVLEPEGVANPEWLEQLPAGHVQEVALPGQEVTAAGLAGVVGRLPGLRAVSLANATFEAAALEGLAHGGESLVTLDLSGSTVNDDGLAVLARAVPQLGALLLRGAVDVTCAGAASLAGLGGLRLLHSAGTRIWEPGYTALRALGNLEEFWPGSALTDSNIYGFTAYPRLRNLYLKEVAPSPDALGSLYQSSALEMLALGRDIDDERVARLNLMQSLRFAWIENQTLSAVGLRGLRGNPDLHALVLDTRNFGPAEANALVSHPRLERLAVAGDLDLETIDSLSYQTQLRSLRINSPAVGDESVAVLGRYGHLRSLQVLRTRLTPDGLAALRAMLPATEVQFEGTSQPGFVERADFQPLRMTLWARTRRIEPGEWHHVTSTNKVAADEEISARACLMPLDDLKGLALTVAPKVTELVAPGCWMPTGLGSLVRRFPELLTIDAAEFRVEDEFLSAVAALPKLRQLVLAATTLDTAQFRLLAGGALPALRHLDVRDTFLDDAALAAARNAFPALEHLNIARTMVTAAACEAFRTARPEVTLVATAVE